MCVCVRVCKLFVSSGLCLCDICVISVCGEVGLQSEQNPCSRPEVTVSEEVDERVQLEEKWQRANIKKR